MATMVPPQKGVEYIFYTTLVSQADVKLMQDTPTLASGDVIVTTDGNAVTNLDTLPAVDPAASFFVKVTVSATEMNGDNIIVLFHDTAGSEWCDKSFNVQTAGQSLNAMDTNIDDIETDTNELQGLIASSKIAAQVKGIDDIDFTATMIATLATELADALGTDAMSELSQGIPTATPTYEAALMLLYMIARNKVTTTASELGVYNDAGTKIAKKALDDDGTTYTEDEMISGA